jgi:hypothetical protein
VRVIDADASISGSIKNAESETAAALLVIAREINKHKGAVLELASALREHTTATKEEG